MSGDLRVFDPIWTTANITGYHGALVYDMLFMVGHSGPTGGYLVLKRTRKEGEVSTLDKYKIRVDALARLLVADGLNRGHRRPASLERRALGEGAERHLRTRGKLLQVSDPPHLSRL